MKYNNLFIGVLLAAIFAFPIIAPAITVEELQIQIKDLLALVSRLQTQLEELTKPKPIEPINHDGLLRHRICKRVFDRPLRFGMRGDDVMELQDFLKSEGHLSANATGYFGTFTAKAVANWQTAEGVSVAGIIGPASRARIKGWCGGGSKSNLLEAYPTSGSAPLTVYFWRVIQDKSSEGFSIDFGDGTSGTLSIGCGVNPFSGVGACPRALTSDHVYLKDGTYIATLYYGRNICPPDVSLEGPRCMAPIFREVVGKVRIKVGTQIYDNPADDPQCKSWFDGCNTCSRQHPGGRGMCTMMACMRVGNDVPKPYCTAWFDEFPSANKPPVISAFSGPTMLHEDQTGTWTINASDPEQGRLSYHVTWGDEPAPIELLSSGTAFLAQDFVQTTTFTHSYSTYGTYTVSIIVRDESGKEAKTSATVRVVTDHSPYCTQEYAPVCGQPPFVCNVPQGLACAQVMPAPKTYSNRCQMNAGGATLLYDGICTST